MPSDRDPRKDPKAWDALLSIAAVLYPHADEQTRAAEADFGAGGIIDTLRTRLDEIAAIKADVERLTGIEHELLTAQGEIDLYKQALASAKNEAYRECAKLACWRCAEGMPMSKSGKTHKDKRWGAMPCPAINIRKARPQAFETVAPAEK